MAIIKVGVGLAFLLIILWDAFETVILPRRVTRRIRLTRWFYRVSWMPWAALARRMRPGRRREAFLSFFGPLSLPLLLGVWAFGLIIGFALFYSALGPAITAPEGKPTFGTALYVSGATFLTLGPGDVTPRTAMARTLMVLEAGTGFGFLAIIIGYLPVIYQAFSRREVNISLLDAHAGSPPSAVELLRRHRDGSDLDLTELLRDWERWAAELMESHLSYPVLCYYRSQHDNQSWLAALTTILDTCALVMADIDRAPARQAQRTFAIARHAVVDLAQIFNTPPRDSKADRLPAADLTRLRESLAADNIMFRDGTATAERLAELRHLYEPYVYALADHLFMTPPRWIAPTATRDNWQTTAWEHRDAGSKLSPCCKDRQDEEHS